MVLPLYMLPHGILRVFNTILYENEFQNPQIFQQTISVFFPSNLLYITIVCTTIFLTIGKIADLQGYIVRFPQWSVFLIPSPIIGIRALWLVSYSRYRWLSNIRQFCLHFFHLTYLPKFRKD
jgi:hypothetical protein